jgi:hypothetical protein
MVLKIIKNLAIETWQNPKEAFRLYLMLGGFLVKYILGAIYWGFMIYVVEKIVDFLLKVLYSIKKRIKK